MVISQAEHERINAANYPGTRQMCEKCDQPTERCEEDAIYLDNGRGPLCEECYHEIEEANSCNIEFSRSK